MAHSLESLEPLLAPARRGRVVFLTGAGISAESGIPTFRGPEGYWTVGSKEYHPQEMATLAAYGRMPHEVWRWYLYRLGVCRSAEPNAAHRALVSLEHSLDDRFDLITQNVDGLHGRAGNSVDCTFEVHGNIERMRCDAESPPELRPMPREIGARGRDEPISPADLEPLRCPTCGGLSRPHVLWFDEYYDEALYRSETALRVASLADLFVVVGTSGATSLPIHAATAAARNGAAIIDVNPDENPFSELAESSPKGAVLRGSACEWVPRLVESLQS